MATSNHVKKSSVPRTLSQNNLEGLHHGTLNKHLVTLDVTQTRDGARGSLSCEDFSYLWIAALLDSLEVSTGQLLLLSNWGGKKKKKKKVNKQKKILKLPKSAAFPCDSYSIFSSPRYKVISMVNLTPRFLCDL